MKKNKKTLEKDIENFLELWNVNSLIELIKELYPICELYNVDEEDDWVRDEVGVENLQNVRLVRTVYLISRLAEFHASKLVTTKINFKDIWVRMKEVAQDYVNENPPKEEVI